MQETLTAQYIELSEIFNRVFTKANHIYRDLENSSIDDDTKALIIEEFNIEVNNLSERVRSWQSIDGNEHINDQNLHLKDCALVALKEILNCNFYESQMALFQLHSAHPLASSNITYETVNEFNDWLNEIKSDMPIELRELFNVNSEAALSYVNYSFDRTSLLDLLASSAYEEAYDLDYKEPSKEAEFTIEKELKRANNIINLIFDNDSKKFKPILKSESVLSLAKEMFDELNKNILLLTFQNTEDKSQCIFENKDEFNLLVGKCVLITAALEDVTLGNDTLTALAKKRVEIYSKFREVEEAKIYKI